MLASVRCCPLSPNTTTRSIPPRRREESCLLMVADNASLRGQLSPTPRQRSLKRRAEACHVRGSVVIPTVEEACATRAVCSPLRRADQVLVADGGSHDPYLASPHERSGPTIAAQRNAALSAARNQWVFALGADQRSLTRSATRQPARSRRPATGLSGPSPQPNPGRAAYPWGLRTGDAPVPPRAPLRGAAGARVPRAGGRRRAARSPPPPLS